MKVKVPFVITRERFAERLGQGEVCFVIRAWIERQSPPDDHEELFERGHAGVLYFRDGASVYNKYGGFTRAGKFVPWEFRSLPFKTFVRPRDRESA